MMTDTALLLRIKVDHKEMVSEEEIDSLLEQSKIVRKLTRDYEENALFLIFRLICLSEIPYAQRLPYTQKVMDWISGHLSLSEGFSYTGNVDYIVPCYNAMLMEAYSRLGKADSSETQNALNWIKQYQVFDRRQQTGWKYDGICKHGGCMNYTPCYIGIGKTVRALLAYAEFMDHPDQQTKSLIEKGTSYMLRHHMYQRLSDHAPVSAHITDIMFPQAYMLSAADLVYIANKARLWADPRTDTLKKLLEHKKYGTDSWKIDYIYSHKGYKAFETKRNVSQWIGYLFQQ